MAKSWWHHDDAPVTTPMDSTELVAKLDGIAPPQDATAKVWPESWPHHPKQASSTLEPSPT